MAKKLTDDEVWSRVQRGSANECWPWLAGRIPKGYGQFGKTYAHRKVYEMVNGRIPEGMMIMHTCDNPPCCNPAHLKAGTALDNQRDASAKRRLRFGERNRMAVLTADDVRGIRADRRGGMSIGDLENKYNASRMTLYRAANGVSWKHLED